MKPADQKEKQLTARLSEGQIAEFIEDDKVHSGEIFREAFPTARPRPRSMARKSPQPILDLEPINALKFPHIVGHQHHFERQRLRRDQKIIRAY